MNTIPSGTVTFLFTDIEGSTRLAREHPAAWLVSRDRHHALLRAAIETRGGFVFQVIGDAFCAAFDRAGAALEAARAAQAGLQSAEWGEAPIRVRMGLHSGEAEWDGQGYLGYLSLALVQRLMSAGHGGQVLLSHATENLLRGALPAGLSLRDLGEHKFKDFNLPMRIYQLEARDLQSQFPALRSLDYIPNNLPVQPNSFVGREKEIADVKRLLNATHLLTLIGPGGTGKTRLSLQAAGAVLTQYPDGVWLVELAPILDPALVARTAAVALGLREEPQRPVLDMLCDYLREKQTLILLDNCEHLVDECARLAGALLRTCPQVRLMASSREALGIAGEVTYRVPSLNSPGLEEKISIETLSQFEAVRLFIERAASALPSFEVNNLNAPFLAQICHRLDGIPLAIELAATRVRVLSLEQIAKKLDDRFRLLTGGSRTALERHQTLRAAIDWSYNLLPPDEQKLFCRLSVFVDGWTLEAAESVCAGDGIEPEDVLDLLEHLINKSLVVVETAGRASRYRMLETLRQYANEKLIESEASNSLRDRHLDYFLGLVEQADPHLRGAEQVEWLPRLRAELENLRLALSWAGGLEDAGPLLRLAGGLGAFWDYQLHWMEGVRWLKTALGKEPDDNSVDERRWRARALVALAALNQQVDEIDEMKACAEQSLALYEALSDKRGTALARTVLAFANIRREIYVQALELLERSLSAFRELGDPWGQAEALLHLAHIHLDTQNPVEWKKYLDELVKAAQASGDRYLIAEASHKMAQWYFNSEQYPAAGKLLDQAEQNFAALGNTVGFSSAWALRVNIYFIRGDLGRAKELAQMAARQMALLGEKNMQSFFLWMGADVAFEEKDYVAARQNLEKVLALDMVTYWREGLAMIHSDLGRDFFFGGDIPSARVELDQSLILMKGVEKKTFATLKLLSNFSRVLFEKNPGSALRLLGAADTYSQSLQIYVYNDRYFYTRTRDALRQRVDEDLFEREFATGQHMTVEQALALARKLVDEMT